MDLINREKAFKCFAASSLLVGGQFPPPAVCVVPDIPRVRFFYSLYSCKATPMVIAKAMETWW